MKNTGNTGNKGAETMIEARLEWTTPVYGHGLVVAVAIVTFNGEILFDSKTYTGTEEINEVAHRVADAASKVAKAMGGSGIVHRDDSIWTGNAVANAVEYFGAEAQTVVR